MTEAENLAKALELMTPRNEGDFATCQEAAALIRSQEAKIERMAEALKDASQNSLHVLRILKMHHADALRDAGVSG